MAKTRQQKEISVKGLAEKLKKMKVLVFTNFAGLSVKDATELRQTLREEQVEYMVVKKALLRRALEQTQLDATMADQLEGGLALAFGYEDEVMPAKLLATFAKDHEALTLIGGVVEGKFVDEKQVTTLAELPGREELIAKTVWTIKAPMTGFANVLAGNLRGLITALNAITEKQPAKS